MAKQATATEQDLETAARLRAVVGRLARLLRATETGLAGEMTPTRVSVLLTADRHGPIRLSEVAEREGINPTMLSRIVGDLVADGLLERTPDAEDRRSAWLQPTAAGRDLAAQVRHARTQAVEGALAALAGEDQRLLRDVLPALELLADELAGGLTVTAIKLLRGRTFAALSIPNYRRYIGGQAISLVGTWMQMTAMSWLVLTLTHSATKLGVIVALQTLPVLILGPYGGVVADRVDKRRTMIGLQGLMGVQALILGVLTVAGAIHYWEIGVLAAALGFNNAFENPARQSFMLELVGPEHLRNAVSLNSTTVNLARVVGPAVGGILIAAVGSGVCFLINAASFVAVIMSLVGLDATNLNPTKPTPRGRGQLRAGLRYVGRTPGLAIPLAMMALTGCLAYEFQVSLPYMASDGLHVGSSGYGFMTAAMAVGAVIGGLVVATRGRTGTWPLVFSAAGFGASMALAAVAPGLAVELLVLAFVGSASVSFMSIGNATLQLRAAPEMRGRVMSLWFVAFQGSTPIGGPLVGVVMSDLGARAGLGVGAVACLVVAAAGAVAMRVRGVAPGAVTTTTPIPVPESIVSARGGTPVIEVEDPEGLPTLPHVGEGSAAA